MTLTLAGVVQGLPARGCYGQRVLRSMHRTENTDAGARRDCKQSGESGIGIVADGEHLR